MKHSKIYIIKRKKHYNLITALSLGVFVMIALICLCSYCISSIDISENVIGVMTDIVLCAGGFASGFRFGKLRRHKGIAGGFLCGLCLGMITMIFGLCYMRSFAFFNMIKNLILLCMSGAVGGVCGVNTKIKRPPP
ncbi:TIGR04086 family membrane protein [Porcipelethomonas sp.]|uniref:TIGR04086 family membrane protein n=1 Tax=Porcipelethomonas sp. TaxID=2981675 RepID=UPI003EF67DD3